MNPDSQFLPQSVFVAEGGSDRQLVEWLELIRHALIASLMSA